MKAGDLGWLIAYNFLIFQDFIKTEIPLFAYFDDVFCLLLLLKHLVLRKKNAQHAPSLAEQLFKASIFLLFLVGILGNIVFGKINNNQAILLDAFACVKFGIVLIAVMQEMRNRPLFYQYLEKEIKVFCIPLIMCMMLNWVVDIGMSVEFRFRIRSFQFVFTHCTVLAATLCDMLAILSINPKRNRVFIILLLIGIASTLRSKAIGFCVLYAGLSILIARGKKIKPRDIVVLGCIAVITNWNQIAFYFSDQTIARAALHLKGLQVANDLFPLGAGFASFASNMASVYYTPLYYQYDLWNVYGLRAGSTGFASDTFWPIIFGQFGWIGVALFLLCLGCLYKTIVNRAKENDTTLAALSIFFYLLIASAAESAFFHPLAVGHFFVMAVALDSAKRDLPANPR
jgi:hypothetical protein